MEESQIKQIIEQQPLHGSALLDPRCKILLLVCIGFVSYFLAGEVVSLALMLVYGLFIAVGNGGKWALKMIVAYIIVAYLNALLRYVQVPVLSVIMSVFGVTLLKLIPIVMMGLWILRTTYMDDLMVALQRMRLPQAVTIPLVVMFRYIPTLRIEYRQIRSTMDIRGISDTLWKRVSHPLATIEYILIPLLMRCLKVTDELAASGTTRGWSWSANGTPCAPSASPGRRAWCPCWASFSWRRCWSWTRPESGKSSCGGCDMISFQNFSFRYEESKDFTLRGIDMTVQTGEFILLTGRSGCGKTTLIRSLNGLIPHFYPGEIQGDLVMDGHSLLEMKPAQLAGQVGTVFQDPRSQFFMTDTTRELAFGCENMGLPREETIDRIAKAAKDLELADYLNRSIFALSSGEKQQIAVGSVYALSPKVYIFDEPSANLDYAATKRLAEIMGKLKRDGYTIFVVEHRFYYLRDLIDRVFLIQNGKIEQEFTREQFCSLPEETRISYGLRTAYPERDAEHYQEKERRPMGKHLLSVQGLSFAYPKEQEVFRNVSFEAHAGDVIGILGHNGAGKTTLLSILTGLLKQRNGEITFDGRKLTPRQRRALSYLVMQDTDYQLFASSVEEELSLGIREDCKEKVDAALEALELSEYQEQHPAALSGGQKQRVTIGAAIVKDSPVIYFDEPTSGLDYDSMVRVSRLIEQLSASGVIVFVVSHDFEFIVRTCTEVVQLDDQGAVQNHRLTPEILKALSEQYFH